MLNNPNNPISRRIQAEVVDIDGPVITGNMSAPNLNLLIHNWPITANQCSDDLISHRDASTPQVTRNTKPMHDLHTVRLFYTRSKQHPFPQIKELLVERI